MFNDGDRVLCIKSSTQGYATCDPYTFEITGKSTEHIQKGKVYTIDEGQVDTMDKHVTLVGFMVGFPVSCFELTEVKNNDDTESFLDSIADEL